VLIAHGKDHVDLDAHGGIDQAVEERVVRCVVWPQQEQPLSRPSVDESVAA
jgi:hypothetical protein